MSADSDELISNLILNLMPSCLNARGFKMTLLNIVSLPNHVDELRISKLFLHFDLLALNETRLDSSISDGLVKIRGYDIVRNDRSRRGGGVYENASRIMSPIVRDRHRLSAMPSQETKMFVSCDHRRLPPA